jgi:hypothetical protein
MGCFVIEDAVNTACRCTTLHQRFFHRNQHNSKLFVHFSLSFRNLGDFLGMVKRYQALM